MRRWTEIAVTLPADAADALTELLVRLGAPGAIEEEAGSERVRVRAHFEGGMLPSGLIEEVRGFLAGAEAHFPGSACAAVESAGVADEDWAEGWKQSFPPLAIGERLYVRTPWGPHAADRLEVEIEPAMAFGTGQHATTAGCLLALEELFASEGTLSPVLDVGTGSGILAIAAARLGASEVVAVDNDPVAIEAARENLLRNGVESVVQAGVGTAEELEGEFPLILANLYSTALRSLFPVFAARSPARAWLVVSGFLDADHESLVAAARTHGWIEHAARSIEGWMTLTFEKRL